MMLPAAAPPPSSSASGVLSWSCVHSPLRCEQSCKVLQNLNCPGMRDTACARQNCASHTPLDFSAVAGCDGTHYGTNPKFSNKPLFANEKLSQFRFSVYRIRMAPPRNGWRRRPARERDLNENIIIVLGLALTRKALNSQFLHSRPWTPDRNVNLYSPAEISRAHCCACQYNAATSSRSSCSPSLKDAAASHSPLS